MGKAELKVEIDADFLAQAAAAGVDVSAVAEDALRAALARSDAEGRAKRWAEDNVEAIAAHRERIERYGVFGEDLRRW